ncbi:MAG: KH domain-containing protein [Candidatus Thorarchaeota archaeon]|jgi:ribosomal RNA assembly protein
MMHHETIRVPEERIAVIVGRNGRVRRRVEKLTNTKIEVSQEGTVTITSPADTEDPVLVWKARDMIRAMARGFSPKRALSLIDEDARLIIISLRDLVGTSPAQLKRVAGRVIGENGRSRRVIEETTESLISIYGKTVSVIGIDPGLEYATRAITMLIDGAPHAAVYKYLERTRRDMNRARAELWTEDL